jgi:hypothetical protein
MQVFTQEGQDVLAFLSFEFGNVDCEERVVEEGVQVGHWMGSDLHSMSHEYGRREGVH